jgi:hypothetical protein
LLLAGCHKDEIKAYRVAKDRAQTASNSELPPGHPSVSASQSPSAPPAMQSMPGAQAMPGMQDTPSLIWTAPSHWRATALGQMRRGSFAVPGNADTEADLSIFVFPGSAGGLAENINRWRGQIGLEPLAADKLADETMPLRSDSGLEFTVVDMSGKNGDRILGAILVQGDSSWFFKLRGSDVLVAKNKPDFLVFLKSVKHP